VPPHQKKVRLPKETEDHPDKVAKAEVQQDKKVRKIAHQDNLQGPTQTSI